MNGLILFAVIVLSYLFCTGLTRLMTPRVLRRRVHYRGVATVAVLAFVVCVV